MKFWLPPASAWNSKYEGLGNGGFGGSIQYEPMSWALKSGYAVSGTDTGYVCSGLDARWAPGHSEKGGRFRLASHPRHRRHFPRRSSRPLWQNTLACLFQRMLGCGREAMMEAQQFPEDYDGMWP